MKPSKPGSLRHRPRLAAFVATTAHCTPLVWVVATVFMAGRQLLARDFRHPLVAVAVLAIALVSLYAQIAHVPGECRRCRRRLPWGKHRVHAGRRALLWSHHATALFWGVLLLVLLAYIVAEWRDAPLAGVLTKEMLRDLTAWSIGLISLGWLGQARMTHTMYEWACPRCRKGGGGGPHGGQPLPVAHMPLSKSA